MASLLRTTKNWLGLGKQAPDEGAGAPDAAGIAAIIGDAATRQELEAPPEPPADIARIAEQLELLTNDIARLNDLKAASDTYYKEFTTEIRWYRWTRLVVVIACAAIVLGLSGLLVVVLRHAKTLFGPTPGHALTALIIGCISGIVIITIAALKGAFTGVKDRNEGLPMPEHLKEAIEAVQTVFGK